MIVTLFHSISHDSDRIIGLGCDRRILFHDQKAVRTNEGCKLLKTFPVGLLGTVNIQVIGIGRGNYGNPGT